MARKKRIYHQEGFTYDHLCGLSLHETDGFFDPTHVATVFAPTVKEARKKMRKQFEDQRDYAQFVLDEMSRLEI